MTPRHVVLLLALALCALAWAQPNPDQLDPNLLAAERKAAAAAAGVLRQALLKELPTLSVRLPQGLFILRNGALARLDPQTLKTQGVVDLFAADLPAGEQPEPADLLKRLYPAAVAVRGEALCLVIGDRFFRVHAATLAVLVRTDVAGPFALDRDRWQELSRPPTLLLDGDALTVIRASQVAAVNVADGKLLATGFLPPELEPAELVLPPKADKPRKAGGDWRNNVDEVVLVGLLVRHTVKVQDVWALMLPDKTEYQLEDNAALDRLLAAPRAENGRVRISGNLRHPPRLPNFADGLLEVVEFQVL